MHGNRVELWANMWYVNRAPSNRWFNLWVPIGEGSEDVTLPSEKDNKIDEEDFVGNIVMFWIIGLLILILHVLLVSAVEAYWLQATKVRSHFVAQYEGIPLESLCSRTARGELVHGNREIPVTTPHF